MSSGGSPDADKAMSECDGEAAVYLGGNGIGWFTGKHASKKTAKCYVVEYAWWSDERIDYGNIGYGGSEWEERHTCVLVEAENEEEARAMVTAYGEQQYGDDYIGQTGPIREYESCEAYMEEFPFSNCQQIASKKTASYQSLIADYDDGMSANVSIWANPMTDMFEVHDGLYIIGEFDLYDITDMEMDVDDIIDYIRDVCADNDIVVKEHYYGLVEKVKSLFPHIASKKTSLDFDYGVVAEIDPSWTIYDKTVANGMLADFGEIYVDAWGTPIDNEYDIADIMNERNAHHVFEKASGVWQDRARRDQAIYNWTYAAYGNADWRQWIDLYNDFGSVFLRDTEEDVLIDFRGFENDVEEICKAIATELAKYGIVPNSSWREFELYRDWKWGKKSADRVVPEYDADGEWIDGWEMQRDHGAKMWIKEYGGPKFYGVVDWMGDWELWKDGELVDYGSTDYVQSSEHSCDDAAMRVVGNRAGARAGGKVAQNPPDVDWRYDVDGYYAFIPYVPNDGTWLLVRGTYVTQVDDDIIAIETDYDGRWTVGTYDEGHSTDSMLLDEHPPYDGFGSVQDAVDWLNEHIGWIGDFRLQKVGAEKASSIGYDIDGANCASVMPYTISKWICGSELTMSTASALLGYHLSNPF